MYVTAIVLAAGKGLRLSRFNSFTVRSGIPTHMSKMIGSGNPKVSKPLIEIDSRPIIIYSLGVFSRHPYIRDIIVTVNSKNSEGIKSRIKKYRINKIRGTVLGGKRRQDSVFEALKAMDVRTELVLIHDAARPFINKKIVSCVIEEAKRSGAAIVGVPVKGTIKSAKRQGLMAKGKIIVGKTLDRNTLWEIQTPQVFKKDLILKAYERYANIEVTDDAALVEKLGVRVSVVKGSHSNIKITTPEDLILAEAIAKSLRNEKASV